ncbi:unnamed protein product [Parascedosporium putredinis]|uniref:Sec39 domain-containing protein n=1 Tax=Parascedosporium putredinis TaxID=1442378 RepID=A0A9P1GYR8_9PEZI|nr:unnamed protein product [Parascedosporium putredinis]CAI7990363.1 unnamed protein product [Parascedosporium putredinis]
MCIEAALRENDFETAYSYVVSRLSPTYQQPSVPHRQGFEDNWSWSAALQAGQYIRTTSTIRPTHLGTANGNLEIRHLEQRVECLATALRIAPPSQLHEILKTFRRCEEQLDFAIRDEATRNAAWDTTRDLHSPLIPGAFTSSVGAHSISATSPATHETEDVPMSLFDLSRATARVAQRNLGVLSSIGHGSEDRGPSIAKTLPDEPKIENGINFEKQLWELLFLVLDG